MAMSQPPSSTATLGRDDIVRALEAVSRELAAEGVTGELCLFGGAVMTLAFAARLATKDVDALFHPASLVREAARRVAAQQSLPEDWLNDGVKGFVSAQHDITAGNLPQFPNLRLTMPVPEYLLAMKCMAARTGGVSGEPSDIADIVFLARHLGLKSAPEVLEIVGRYYPAERTPPKTQFLIEGLFEEGAI